MGKWQERVKEYENYLNQTEEWKDNVDSETWESLPEGVRIMIFAGISDTKERLPLWRAWAKEDETQTE